MTKVYPSCTETVIELGTVDGGFQWRKEDGVIVSPVFSTIEEAFVYSKRMSFLTSEEWKEYYPNELRDTVLKVFTQHE